MKMLGVNGRPYNMNGLRKNQLFYILRVEYGLMMNFWENIELTITYYIGY